MWVKGCDTGSCVEVWHTASAGNGACVEVGIGTGSLCDDSVYIRDSKDPDGQPLRFTPEEFGVFRDGVKAGVFDHIGS